jgi:NADH-quinone oxidoreductase subunit F
MSNIYELIKSSALDKWETLSEGKPWIRVGGGVSGEAAGSDEIFAIVERSVTENGLDVNISSVGSLGLMYLEPIIDIKTPNGPRIFYGNVEEGEVVDIVVKHLIDNKPLISKAFAYEGSPDEVVKNIDELSTLPAMSYQKKIVTSNFGNIDPNDIDQYIANGGYKALDIAVNDRTPGEVVDEVKTSGLRGRGGAAFPTGLKWSFLAPSDSEKKYVLCNSEEGDPGAFNDKGILESDPHTLIEGLIINGYATRSTKGYVFIRHGHNHPISATNTAIKQAYEKGFLGTNILGSDFSFDMELALTGDSYVAGEETALMEAIEGKRSTPRFKPPFPAAAGLWQKPTNINNVKTISYVPKIVENGADWFKSIGTESTSGTALVCLSGHVTRPGLYEVEMGKTIRHVLEELGGGGLDGNQIKVLQAGGPLNGILGEAAFDTKIDFDEMSKAGASIGSGGIIVGNKNTDIVDLLRNLIAFNQFESCGKCFPCRLGNTHMLEILDRLCQQKAMPKDLDLIEKIGTSMKIGSLCGHGQLGYNPISSALRYFKGEIDACLNKENEMTGPFRNGTMMRPTRTRPQ